MNLFQRLRQFLFRQPQPAQRQLDGFREPVNLRTLDEPRGRVSVGTFICLSCRREDFASGAELVSHRCVGQSLALTAGSPRLSLRAEPSEQISEGGVA